MAVSVLLSPDVFFGYVCPFLGCLFSASMCAAPISDLRQAMLHGSLGALNALPWTVMTGNCLGWCAYAYYKQDVFVLASNLPGLVLSFWLNMGAAKLQYYEMQKEHPPYYTSAVPTTTDNRNRSVTGPATNYSTLEQSSLMGFGSSAAAVDTNARSTFRQDASPPIEMDEDHSTAHVYMEATSLLQKRHDSLVFTPQEVWFFRFLLGWSFVLVWTGWILPNLPSTVNAVSSTAHTVNQLQATTIGILVNINLIFFYASPLQKIKQVMTTKNSAPIHRPTMFTNWLNTSFWMMYGFAQNDPVLYIPNALGLGLGISQGILCAYYPCGLDLQELEQVFGDEQHQSESRRRLGSATDEATPAEEP